MKKLWKAASSRSKKLFSATAKNKKNKLQKETPLLDAILYILFLDIMVMIFYAKLLIVFITNFYKWRV